MPFQPWITAPSTKRQPTFASGLLNRCLPHRFHPELLRTAKQGFLGWSIYDRILKKKEGKGAALVLPRCNSAAMSLHLAEIAACVAPGAHAVLLLGQAGWHLSDKLLVPSNITLLPLPPKCPELNPVENIWQFMRDNRVFHSYRAIVDHCCYAWNKLVAQPWIIMSIGLRDWAHGF